MKFKALIIAAALGSGALAAVPASAMPIANLADVAPANVEQVRMVCGRYRCWWQPGPRFGMRFYGQNAYAYGGRDWRHRHMGPRFYRY